MLHRKMMQGTKGGHMFVIAVLFIVSTLALTLLNVFDR
jgi:hypothetical protein